METALPPKELQIFLKGVFDLPFVSLRKRTPALNIAAVVLVAFIIANLVFIWVNSAKVDTSSNKDSKKLAETIVKTTTKDYESLPKTEQQKKIKEANAKIRSAAHFAEFIPLGLFILLLCLNLFFCKGQYTLILFSMLLSVILCALCALSDEIHQIFVKGRAFEVKDIFTDTLGSFVGIAFGTLFYLVIYRIKLFRNKEYAP